MSIEWQIKLSSMEWAFIATFGFVCFSIFFHYFIKAVFSNHFLTSNVHLSLTNQAFKENIESSEKPFLRVENCSYLFKKSLAFLECLFLLLADFFRREKNFSSSIRNSFLCFIGKLLIPVFLLALWLQPVLVFNQPGKAEILLVLDDSQSMNRPLNVEKRLPSSDQQIDFGQESNSFNSARLSVQSDLTNPHDSFLMEQNESNNESFFHKTEHQKQFRENEQLIQTPFEQAKNLIEYFLLKEKSLPTLNFRIVKLSDPLLEEKKRSVLEKANNPSSPIRAALNLIAENQDCFPVHSVILLSDGIENPSLASNDPLEYPFAVHSIGLGATSKPFDLTFQCPQEFSSNLLNVESNVDNSSLLRNESLKLKDIVPNDSIKASNIVSENLNKNDLSFSSKTKGNVFCHLSYDSLNNEAVLESFLFISGLSEKEFEDLATIHVELAKISSPENVLQTISSQNVSSVEFIKNQNYFLKKLTFRWNPAEKDRLFRLTAFFEDKKDWNEQNNSFDFILEKELQPIQVLLIDEEPRYEYRFLRELLRRESYIRLNTLLLSADPKVVENDPIAISNESLTSEKLAEYDVIIFGDISPESLGLTFSRLEKLFQNEESDVSGWFIAGDRFMPHEYENNFLGSILSNLSQQTFEETSGNDHFFIEPTDPFAEIFSNLSSSDFRFEVSRIYPQEFSGDRFRVLASSGNIPIFMTTYSNRHRILWQGTDELWKIHCGTRPEIYRTFVLNSLHYLSRRNFIDHEFQKDSYESSSFVLREQENVVCQMSFLSKIANTSNGNFFDLSENNIKNQYQTVDELIQIISQLSSSKTVIQKNYIFCSIILFFLLLLLLVFIWRSEQNS